MIDKFTRLLELFKDLDSKLGVKKLMIYTAYFFLLSSVANWKGMMMSIESLFDIRHSEKLQIRAEIESEISNHLRSLRAILNADRILLFEYHNTVSGISGIPFRFMSLTQIEPGYRIPQINQERYKSINTGIVSDFTSYIERYQYLESRSFSEFYVNYPTMGRILDSDSIRCLSVSHLTGSSKPLGFILVEWTTYTRFNPNWDEVKTEVSKVSQRIVSSLTNRKEE